MKVLHILDHYKPHFSGYVFRTSYILKYQKELGLEPVIVTSPKNGNMNEPVEEIDDMHIYRTSENNFGSIPYIKEKRLMQALQTRIEEVIQKEQPDIIHAHSPSLNGMPSVKVAKKYNIPIVYEVRAFWEDAAVDHGSFVEGSFKYRASRFIETRLMKKTNALFTICSGLRHEIISRGIQPEKITIIPNGVDTHAFSPLPYDKGIADSYGLKNKTVFGFIGSFYHYEGLSLLIDSYKNVLKNNSKTKLLLVGDGPDRTALIENVKESGLSEQVIFTGKIPHDEIKRYYSVMDILVYPRRRMRLTELVTPLKPLEAMAVGKFVVGSDVGGIKELISHNHNGFLFRAEDTVDLSKILSALASGMKDLNGISTAAIETVRKNHDWKTAVGRYLPVYEKIIRSKRSR
jgi:PEP-CTERM/exosortase A-associated glycosyltransferase